MKYLIPGDPIPLARPRYGGRHVWDSQKFIKNSIGILLTSQHSGPLYTGPIHIDVTFFMALPKSMSAKKKNSLFDTYHYKKPDVDNLIKFLLDTATGIIFSNDCIVASISAKKIYTIDPYTEFTVIGL